MRMPFQKGFFREDLKVEDRRHLVFATDNQLELLRNAVRWYVDGTFKCMRFPFIMFLTIHAFVRRADCSKQVPLAYVLMTGRKTRDYVAVFESMKRLLGTCSLAGFVMDYEKGLWRAARHVFPEIDIKGCAFHWGQAVYRHVQELGLATQYTSDRGTNSFIRKILCLPFVPAEHIPGVFENLPEFNTCEEVDPLLDYIDRIWMRSTIWPVEDWCVFGQSVRTNNDDEGWHRRLNHRAGVSPPVLYLVEAVTPRGRRDHQPGCSGI